MKQGDTRCSQRGKDSTLASHKNITELAHSVSRLILFLPDICSFIHCVDIFAVDTSSAEGQLLLFAWEDEEAKVVDDLSKVILAVENKITAR